jgi:hypothetical protein
MRGRPPISNPKSKTVNVPMTPADKARLDAIAAANEMTTASLVRAVLLDRQTDLLAA